MAYRTANRELMREINRKLVLEVIRDNSPISQIDIIKNTQLSGGTITHIVRELKKMGFLDEIGYGSSSAGRRPRLLQFNERSRFVIGIELVPDLITITVMDLNGNLVKQLKQNFVANQSPQKVLKHCCRQTMTVLKGASISPDKILGIGVSTDGAVNLAAGRLLFSVNLGWQNVDIKEIIEAETALPCIVDTTASCMALGEYLQGTGQKSRCMLFVYVGSGVGSVLVTEQGVFRGAHDFSGEIGHSLAMPNGPVCKCGKQGCLEAVASGAAVISKIKNEIRAGVSTEIQDSDLSGSHEDSFKRIAEAVKNGDTLARKILEEASYYLGVEIARQANFCDPDVVVLSGYVFSQSDGWMLNLVRKEAEKYILEYARRNIRIEEGSMKDKAALLGLSASICEPIFDIKIG